MAKRTTSKAGGPIAETPGRYATAPHSPRPGHIAETPPVYAGAAEFTVVSATDAARRFSDIVSRASYQRETFVIERGGRPVCKIGPLETANCSGAELLATLARLPRPHADFLDAVDEAVAAQKSVGESPWER